MASKLVVVLGFLLIVSGCGAPAEVGAIGYLEPQVVATPAAGRFGHIVQAEVGVRDGSGKVRAGVAYTRGGFPSEFSAYIQRLTVRLATEAEAAGEPLGTKPQAKRYAERKADTIAMLSRQVEEHGAISAFAFVFEDDDITGWMGPTLTSRAAPNSVETPGVVKSALDVSYPDVLSTWYSYQVDSSYQYLCQSAQDYGSVQNGSSCGRPNYMKFYGNGVQFSPTYSVGYEAPLFGWGVRSNGPGLYYVTLTQVYDGCYVAVGETLVCTIY